MPPKDATPAAALPRFKIGRHWWRFKFVPRSTLPTAWGDCDSPSRRGPTLIRLVRGMGDRRRLEVLIHEMLHALAWDVFDEEFVRSSARQMSRVLWAFGYRTKPDVAEVRE